MYKYIKMPDKVVKVVIWLFVLVCVNVQFASAQWIDMTWTGGNTVYPCLDSDVTLTWNPGQQTSVPTLNWYYGPITPEVDYHILSDSRNTERVIRFLKPGTYYISAGGTSIEVFIPESPVITLTATKQTANPYEAVTLTASGGNTYTWRAGNVELNEHDYQITVSPEQTTTYTVIGTGLGACPGIKSVTITVNQSTDPYNWTQATVYGETFVEEPTSGGVSPGNYGDDVFYLATAFTLPQGDNPLIINANSQKKIYVSNDKITVKKGLLSIAAGGSLEMRIDALSGTTPEIKPGTRTEVADSRNYSDGMGRITQSQSKDVTRNELIVGQTLYDQYALPAIQTLSAPVGQGGFRYVTNFVTYGGAPYNFTHFDQTHVNSPLAVDNTNPNTLGVYYSSQNVREPLVATTRFPYARTYVDPKGNVSRTSIAGDQHRMGNGHETRSAVVPLLNDLDNHYLKVRNLFVATDPAASLLYKGVKSVSIDINGRESISFTDTDGKLLATCRTDASFPAREISGNITGGSDAYYLDVHIPNTDAQTVLTIQWGNVRIYSQLDGSVISESATGNLALAPGFYRIESLGGTQTIRYSVKYGEFSYQIYDDIGRQLASIAPKGVDLSTIPTSKNELSFVTTFETAANGDMTKASLVDEGTTEYVYRRDGTLRFSQNAQQKLENKFSYINYDRIGRVLQSGVYTSVTPFNATDPFEVQLQAQLTGFATILEDRTRSGGLDPVRCSETTNTYYDIPATDVPGGRVQRFTLGAASKTSNVNVTTWYSYDELGQKEWMIQDIAGLGVKIIDYRYDRNGNLREVAYQRDTPSERFSHYYTYDADMRLLQVHTSRDNGLSKKLQATYLYYLHGPLKRVEIADKLQGIDYVYTIQGWLKSINHVDKAKDPGKDGTGTSEFAPDVFGMNLEYFAGDYTGANSPIASMPVEGTDYYSGRLKAMSWHTQKPTVVTGTMTPAQAAALEAPTMQAYTYDTRYQLTQARWGGIDFTKATNGQNAFVETNLFRETITGYDVHGNILGLIRTDQNGNEKHNFTYIYENNGKSNKLSRVDKVVKDQNGNSTIGGTYANYAYDAIGQLIGQEKGANSEALSHYLEYDAFGLVVAVYDKPKTDPSRQKKVSYTYDEAGLRVKKINHVTNITTYYVGGVIYDNTNTSTVTLKEIPIEGAGRIGVYRVVDSQYTYELSDHLGNVRAVISETKSSGKADVLEYSDYYAMGGIARRDGTVGYRYGYQGQYAELEQETGWNAFELRMYDPVIGRWVSPDPYGQYDSPYVGMGNDWPNGTDPDGGFFGPGPAVGTIGSGTAAATGGVGSAMFAMGQAVNSGMSAAASVLQGAYNSAWHAVGIGPQYDNYSFRQKVARLDAQFAEGAREPMTKFGRGIASFSPVEHVINIGTGIHHDENLWGEPMEGWIDYAHEGLGVIPSSNVYVKAGKTVISQSLNFAKKARALGKLTWAVRYYKDHKRRMEAIDHIWIRHSHGSTYSDVSRFSSAFKTKNQIKGLVTQAWVKAGKPLNTFVYDLGRVIGTKVDGVTPTTKIMVYMENGAVRSAHPW
ncbi:RHS repeat-associated core domain-containing protein [Xanthocytophaga agilis]|uniref:RHS repeat-associated core domain-containing protein n=1 Tax=Xanthocytophaga agilis TaxID=3048010 RepID=A0AAE3UG14_9BACT|nr:RHS repeat-associated core domain-containing protein [Xanthocytophaga agilis]MDJ1501168.1 RHS repeat-associated core domain-containing protein [Xanthocytophaga agilis]